MRDDVAGPDGSALSEGLGPNAQDDERERTSYLTADEVQAAQKLHQRAEVRQFKPPITPPEAYGSRV